MALYIKEPYIPASMVQQRRDAICTTRILHTPRIISAACTERRQRCVKCTFFPGHSHQKYSSCTWCPEMSGEISMIGRLLNARLPDEHVACRALIEEPINLML